ncbi:MAG TPA: mercury methylation corrinoid protein HgcA [Bacteroidales bacterium]|nr:mercury methylation corrinoid protein HgcA [Bacteroidales bacterium]
MTTKYITGNIKVNDLVVPRVSTSLTFPDFLGAVMVRWGFRRDRYMVSPGLYAIGTPGPGSDVFVTASYKLTFDHLRRNLQGIDGWLLVLDTRGVNVWCAAGKGTFGTDELIKQIKSVSLSRIVMHKRIILPQLGATGVAAHKVKSETGFNVHYGPVRSADIKSYINAGYHADKEMRKVKFGLADRVKLIPNDFLYGKYYLLGAMLIVFLLSGSSKSGISYNNFSGQGMPALMIVFLAYFAGIVVTPVLLPYLPGHYFSLKGFFSGMLVFIGYLIFTSLKNDLLIVLSWLFITGALSSFTAMNFTGSSTFTSLSGVKKEMKLFVPLQAGFAVIGIILNVIGKLN